MKGSAVIGAIVAASLATAAYATQVEVTVTGEVEFNQVRNPPLSDVMPGDAASLTFLVDSNVFMNSMSFPTRGYDIDQSSFMLTLGAVTVGLQNPFPMGETAYFVLRDNDPAVDGFIVADSVDFPTGVPLDQAGNFDQFRNNYYVTYTGDTLDSLDILDALGTYDFTNLTVYNWTIDDGPFNAMGIIFQQMTITAVVEPLTFDIKPGSCPNPLNRRSQGVLPAAVLGTADYDVSNIDLSSVMLSRADGVGGSVSPLEGPPGPHSTYEDVGTPYGNEDCMCDTSGPDGILDLSMKFGTQDVVDALELGDLAPGSVVELVVSGYLVDGTSFEATDCITIVPPGDVNGDMRVDVLDFAALSTSWGQDVVCGTSGDLNGDCVVDVRDFGILIRNFGTDAE